MVASFPGLPGNQTGNKASKPTIMFVLPIYPDERVTLDFGRTLQQARMAKSWTQKELATVSLIPLVQALPASSPCS